jgi:hypothetical protein
MEVESIQTENEIAILNKESELKANGYSLVSETSKLKPFQYIKRSSSSLENPLGGTKLFYISWHK